MAASSPIARTYRDAYAPAVPSPLNPCRNASVTAPSSSPASSSPARPIPSHIRRRSKNARKCTSVSPTQRLLRQKAAEAWRAQLISRQAARVEARRIQAMVAQKALEARLQRVLQEVPSVKRPGETPGCGLEAGSPNEPQPYAFHMPDVGFFTPRKVVLAMGLMRRAMPTATPPLGNENFLRVPMAA